MSSHESIQKILARSRMLRQRTDAMVVGRQTLSRQPRNHVQSKSHRMAEMLEEIRSEVKGLQNEDATLMLQMQRLYTDMRKVTDKLSREKSVDSVNDQEDEGEDTELQRDTGYRQNHASPSISEVPDIRVVRDEYPLFGHFSRRKSVSTGNLSGVAKRLSTLTTSTTSDYGTDGGDPDQGEDCMCADCEEKRLKELHEREQVRQRAYSVEPCRRRSPTRLNVTGRRSTSRLSLRMSNGDIQFDDDDYEDSVYV